MEDGRKEIVYSIKAYACLETRKCKLEVLIDLELLSESEKKRVKTQVSSDAKMTSTRLNRDVENIYNVYE